MGDNPEKCEVPMGIPWRPAWLSWVGSVTMCLKALGVDCDEVDVAGQSGYAFALSINEGLCPSGPTSVDWPWLSSGVMNLGRSVMTFSSGDCYTEGFRNARTKAHARAAFDMARAELAVGKPCVVWGLGIPEFGVARGYDGDEYLCVAGGHVPERVRWDAVDAPGGPYVLAFPTPCTIQGDLDHDAVRRALIMMGRPNHGAGWTCGPAAFEFWIEQLRGRHASRFGNSYNAQCWAEARGHARDFLGRVSDRLTGGMGPLGDAHRAFGRCAEALGIVAGLFPFTQEPGSVEEEDVVGEAVGQLEAAAEADQSAWEGMAAALEEWPEE